MRGEKVRGSRVEQDAVTAVTLKPRTSNLESETSFLTAT